MKNNPKPYKPLTISQEREAERTLLYHTYKLSEPELVIFLSSLGVPREEYNLLLDKYKHLLEKLKNASTNNTKNRSNS